MKRHNYKYQYGQFFINYYATGVSLASIINYIYRAQSSESLMISFINNFDHFYYMKQLIEIKVNNGQQKQEIYLPHLRTKSMSIPTLKFHVNYANRYHDRKTREDFINSRNFNDKKWIINLEEIEKKGKPDHTLKLHASTDKRKILSQYETIDLWKEKHSCHQEYILPRRLVQGHREENELIGNNLDFNFQSKAMEQEKIYHLKKSNKQNNLQLRIKKQVQREKSIPDEVVVHRINQIQKLRKDEKLQTVLKRETKEQIQVKKSLKSSIPVFEKPIAPIPPQKTQQINPTKWQTARQYTEEDHF